MLLSAVSVLVVAQSSSEIPEELMNNPVFLLRQWTFCTGFTCSSRGAVTEKYRHLSVVICDVAVTLYITKEMH